MRTTRAIRPVENASRGRTRDASGRSRAAGPALGALLLLGATGCSFLGMGGDRPADRMGTDARLSALDESRTKTALHPTEPYWPYRTGEIYAAMDSTASATAALRTALARDPDYAPAISLLSRIQYDAGDHAAAIALLDGYVAAHPDAPDEIRAALALHLDAVDEIERAEEVMAACTGASGEVYAARAYVSLRGNTPGSALEVAKAALDADGSAVNYNNYGVALLHAGKPLEAREAFAKALDENGTLPGALYNMSLVEVFYFFDEAAGRKWFDKYTQVALEDPDNLASVFKVDMTRLSRPGAAR